MGKGGYFFVFTKGLYEIMPIYIVERNSNHYRRIDMLYLIIGACTIGLVGAEIFNRFILENVE